MNEREFWGRGMEDARPDETAEVDRFADEGGAMMPVPAKLPDTNPKSQYGTKKPSLLSCVPASALIIEGQVMALGRHKYGPFNWRDNSVAASVYIDAAIRHLLAWNSGQDDDPESGVSHLGHVRACMGILIDAVETGNLVDDRPKDEATTRLLNQYTRKD